MTLQDRRAQLAALGCILATWFLAGVFIFLVWTRPILIFQVLATAVAVFGAAKISKGWW